MLILGRESEEACGAVIGVGPVYKRVCFWKEVCQLPDLHMRQLQKEGEERKDTQSPLPVQVVGAGAQLPWMWIWGHLSLCPVSRVSVGLVPMQRGLQLTL